MLHKAVSCARPSGADAADGEPFHAIEQRHVSQCRTRKQCAAEYRLVIWEPQSRERAMNHLTTRAGYAGAGGVVVAPGSKVASICSRARWSGPTNGSASGAPMMVSIMRSVSRTAGGG